MRRRRRSRRSSATSRSLKNALGALLGRNPGPIRRQALDSLKLPPVPQGVPSDVLDRRPDVVAAEQTLVAANARIGLAKSQYFPTISLTSALGLASDQLQWLLARTARAGDINAGLAGVLFDGGRSKAKCAPPRRCASRCPSPTC